MNNKVIYTSADKTYRILEIYDQYYDLDNLKGDSFKPEANPDISLEVLQKDEQKFERDVNAHGVFGYALEYWNPLPDNGWTHVDSCFGFIGEYNPSIEKFCHYIVPEMIQTILKSQVRE